MQKLQQRNRKMTSRRAVAPVIATLLLVAIAVVGGSIIFVFSQGFFSSAQVSGAPQIESIEIVGYDASDVQVLIIHDGLCTNSCVLTTDWDGGANNGLLTGERVAVYVQNQSAQRVTLNEVLLAGTIYDYNNADPLVAFGASVADQYQIVTSGVDLNIAEVKDDVLATLEAGEEATILFTLEGGIQNGRDAQFKIETANGAVFVGTIIAGQQSG